MEWRAVDLSVGPRVVNESGHRNIRDIYGFTLVVLERSGRPITIRQVESEILQAGTTPSFLGSRRRLRGPWTLPADGELRFHFMSYVSSGSGANWPAWTIRLAHDDESGQAIETTFEIALPPPSQVKRIPLQQRPREPAPGMPRVGPDDVI